MNNMNFMQYTTDYISGVMSLRNPQEESLKILEDIINDTNLMNNENIEEILNNQKDIKPNNYTNKVLISELEKKKYYQSIFLKIDNNISKLIESGTEINFVDVKKYIIEKKLEKEYLEILECFNQDEDYELLVGIKKDTP